MTNITFASNNLVHWPLSELSTLADSFDATRVPYSIFLNYNQSMSSIEFGAVAGNVTWFHFRMYFTDAQDGNSNTYDFPLIQAFDANANLLFQMTKTMPFDPDWKVNLKLYHDGGSITGDQQFPFNQLKMNSVDIRYENNGTNLVNLKLYVNGGLAKELDYVGLSSFGKPVAMQLGAAFSTAGGDKQYVSEIIVADGDTRNARLNLLRPTAVGGETDWVGIATDLADDDPTSGMTSILANERQTLDLSAYTGAGNISALVISTVAIAGVNAPQNIRHTVRMSAVNYDGPADLPLSEALSYGITDFQINPATSQPWTSADLATLEMGFISKT